MGGKPKRGGDRRAKRDMPFADDGQQYARVLAMLGNNRVRAKLADATERVCKIRGSMRRRQWVHVGDVVLVALREELAGDTADVVFCYQPAEVQHLQRLGELPDVALRAEDDGTEDIVVFEGDPDDVPARDPFLLPPPRRLGMPDSDSDFDLDDV